MTSASAEAQDAAAAALLTTLSRALTLGDGFALHLLTVQSTADGNRAIEPVEAQCNFQGRPREPLRIDPYRLAPSADGPLASQAVIDGTLASLSARRGGAAGDAVLWLDLTRVPVGASSTLDANTLNANTLDATDGHIESGSKPAPLQSEREPSDESTIRALFRALNEHRNHIARVLDAPLVLLATPRLMRIFAEEAPVVRTATQAARVEGDVKAARQRLAQAPKERAHKAALANALRRHSRTLGEEGKHHEALALAQEALSLTRELAHGGHRFDQELGGMLNNLGNRHAALGQLDEALKATHEATGIYRSLVADHPQAFSAQFKKSQALLEHIEPLAAADAEKMAPR